MLDNNMELIREFSINIIGNIELPIGRINEYRINGIGDVEWNITSNFGDVVTDNLTVEIKNNRCYVTCKELALLIGKSFIVNAYMPNNIHKRKYRISVIIPKYKCFDLFQ